MTTASSNKRLIDPLENDFAAATLVDPPQFAITTPFHREAPPVQSGEIVVLARPRAVAAAAAMHPRGAVAIRPTKQASAAAATQLGMAPLAHTPDSTPWPEVASEDASENARTHVFERIEDPAIEPADVPAEAPESQSSRWKSFEDIGLAPSKTASKAAKLVVSTYRLVGFAILTLIVLVLIGYIASTAFYFFNHTWVAPVAVSPSDEKVVALRAQLAAQQNERDKLAEDLAMAERTVAAEQTFQLQFAKAIRHDLEGRKAALDRVRHLAGAAAAARAEIKRTSSEYASSSEQRMNDEYQAGLIDRQDMLTGKFQLAQISSSNLSLAERQAEFEQRAAELASETKALDALLADKATDSALSYDVLKIQREYEASKLELAKDLEARSRLQASLARQDEILDGLRDSAYLRALADHATVALVPYDNLEHVTKGTPLYGCKVAMLVCHQVGTVLEVLPGEIQVKHPHRDATLRGQMIELRLDDASAGQDEVLFAGGAPLGL